MELEYQSFKSDVPGDGRYRSRFAEPEIIQSRLAKICEAWETYLKFHIDRTEILFNKPELPWLNTERAIVSTLSSSIARAFPNSIVMEECRVAKPGRGGNSSAIKSKDWGRCDLWASINDKAGDFSFYLEAKKSFHDWNVHNLGDFLLGKYGIGKMFRDYLKSHPQRLTQRSPYHQVHRRHPHYILGMLVTPLQKTESNYQEIRKILKCVFEDTHDLPTAEEKADWKRRHMARYPTVGMIVTDSAHRKPGFIASFTVLGATRGLVAKTDI